MDHCPLVCAKEWKPARIEKRAGIKNQKSKLQEKDINANGEVSMTNVI